MDYNFVGKLILVLQKKAGFKNIRTLVLLTEDYDTILVRNNLPKSSSKIFKDCLNNFHLITKDSAYQVIFFNDSISFFNPVAINRFYQILGNCLFRINYNIFFEEKLLNGYAKQIYYINENTKNKKVFIDYYDTIRFEHFKSDLFDISARYWGYYIAISSVENDSLLMSNIRNYEHHSRFIKEFADRPVENVVCSINDSIIYFNFIESNIQLYSDFVSPPLNIKTDFHLIKGYPPQIIIANVSHKIFALFKSNGYYNIYRVLFKNGLLQHCTKIPIYFADSIKINNDFLYFLSKKNFYSNSVRKIYRKRICVKS